MSSHFRNPPIPLQFSRGTLLLQLHRCLFAQRLTQDLAGWVLRDHVSENHPTGDPLGCGDFAGHELGDVVGTGRLTGFEDDVCTWTFVIVAFLGGVEGQYRDLENMSLGKAISE